MDPISRPGRLMLGLSCLLAATTAGCQTVSRVKPDLPKPPAPTKPAARQATKNDQQNLPKTDFQRTVSKNQEFNVHIDMGKLQESQSNYEGALAEFQKALDVSTHTSGLLSGASAHATERAQAHRRMAGALDHLGKFTDAEEHYRQAVKLAPNDVSVWNDSGYSYYMQGRFEQAERCLRNAEKLAPQDTRVQTNLGLTLAAAGKTNDALVILSKANGPAVGHANLAYLLAAMGRTPEARLHYQQAIQLRPEMPLVKEALARLEMPALPALPPALTAQNTPVPQVDASIRRTAVPRVVPKAARKPMMTKVPTPTLTRTPTTTPTPTTTALKRKPLAPVYAPSAD